MRIDYIFIAGNSERSVSEFFIFPQISILNQNFSIYTVKLDGSKIEHISYILGKGFNLMQSPSHFCQQAQRG